MLQEKNITLNEFLSAYFAPTDTVCLRVLDDHRGGAFKGAKMECEAAKIDEMTDNLRRHNAQGRGIFFTVNSGGHTDAEISRINAQFVEMDNASFEEQEARIIAFPLPPNVIVRTQKSYHVYWLVDGADGNAADVGKFRHIQKQLVAHFDGDPACVNESRVMRLPGFNHCKREPVEVACMMFAPERRYTQEQLTAVLPKIPDENSYEAAAGAGFGTSLQVDEKLKSVKKGARKGLSLVGKRCDFIQYCKQNATSLSEGLWYSMISNLAVFDGGDRVIHALSKPYSGYNYAETQDKINHFLESGTKPMTCMKIAEYGAACGFRCPKMFENGSNACECKSPAALAFKPLTADELLEYLKTFDKKPSPIENIQAATQFIKEYLYNIEPTIAETLINYNVKAWFDFKASDLKPLLTLHREMYKKFLENKDKGDKRSTLFEGEL